VRKKVIVTGAAGNLGRKLRVHLSASDQYDLQFLDRTPNGEAGIIAADLSVFDKVWLDLFEGADAIIHLAANANAAAGWHELIGPNMDCVLNIYLAAVRHNVQRIVFASSVWVLAGHRFDTTVRSAASRPDPTPSAYGATKLFGERIGRAFFDAYGISTIAVRLGACRPGKNSSSEVAGASEWTQDCWLSDDDMCRGIGAALNAPKIGFTVINLVSANPRARWSLREAQESIGYCPVDTHVTTTGVKRQLRSYAARVCGQIFPRFANHLIALDW
jgi:NAD+ dependent glucose-6-phosphate dehydrogenase